MEGADQRRGLKEVVEERTVVVRGGRRREIRSEELVPGDFVHLDSGRRVPADIRLLAARNLRVDESLLTGESLPVQKNVEASLARDTVVGDRVNMLHAGTIVIDGRAGGSSLPHGYGYAARPNRRVTDGKGGRAASCSRCDASRGTSRSS